jgi:hypothetical protein
MQLAKCCLAKYGLAKNYTLQNQFAFAKIVWGDAGALYANLRHTMAVWGHQSSMTVAELFAADALDRRATEWRGVKNVLLPAESITLCGERRGIEFLKIQAYGKTPKEKSRRATAPDISGGRPSGFSRRSGEAVECREGFDGVR